MKYSLRQAITSEFQKIRSFYHEMTDWLDTVPYGPGWKKDIYPAPEDLMSSIEKGELWVYENDGEYAAAMIVNSNPTDGYEKVKWNVDAKDNEVSFIHALGVHPEYQRKGVSTAMVNHAISLAKSKNHKAMRLDVLEGNLPAEKLYPKHGFCYITTLEIFYEDTGWANYKLYELGL